MTHANLRFVVSYIRTDYLDGTENRVVRNLYAPTWADAAVKVATLPRWVRTLNVVQVAHETEAEVAARIAREHAKPMPRGC